MTEKLAPAVSGRSTLRDLFWGVGSGTIGTAKHAPPGGAQPGELAARGGIQSCPDAPGVGQARMIPSRLACET